MNAILDAFRMQAMWCERLGSPLTAALLLAGAVDFERGADGMMKALIPGWDGRPWPDGLPLRFAGALHCAVLSGKAPGLARLYPTAGGVFERDALWAEAAACLADNLAFCRDFIQATTPQTNEVMRASALLPGFLEIARRTDKPLALCEIGASAGLNLICDRFALEAGGVRCGAQSGPVRLSPEWQGAPAPAGRLEIAARAGCDLAPIDIRRAESRRRLRAYVWGDQPGRLARLDAVLRLAQEAEDFPAIEQSAAADFLARILQRPVSGVARVVYHSVVWPYLSAGERAQVTRLIEQAGGKADADAPLAWLKFEWGADQGLMDIRLRLWPGGSEERLGRSHPHGNRIIWGG